jgi:sn-glycerol 3-phosphate transport system substrate-binding protein
LIIIARFDHRGDFASMKKLSVLLLVLLVALVMGASLAIAPVTFAQNATPVPAPTITPVPPVAKPEGAIEVTFWYGLGGLLGNVVQETVNMYNSSQSTYYVNAVFQSSYDDTINKINAGLASGELPDLAQVFEAGTQRMIDTGSIVPVQTLFERDGLTSVIEDMEPAVRANYTVGGTLYSAPFNSSTAMLYINRAAFVEAGLNPDEPLVTFDQVAEYARALTVKDANGNTTRYGIALYPEGWFFEQIHAVHDQLMGEPANGRSERMTAYAYNNPIGVQWLEWQKQMIDEGTAIYFGPGGGTPANVAFTRGEAAMVFSSIASLRTLVAGAEGAGAGVEVGTLYMPRNPDATGKTIVGGASLWITNVGSTEQQEGAWDFVKWALTPETQAFWAANTGYYPVVRAAYEQQVMQDALARFPQFQVALDQIRLADISDANTAHISGTFVSMRQDVITAMDQYFTGVVASAQEALDAAVAQSNEVLEEYNLTVSP